MARELKFRAWDGEKMWYPQHDERLTIQFFGPGRIPWGVYDIKDGSRKVTGDPNATLNTPGILMQFTGLKDKNGTEIYEGDIIRMAGKFWYIVRFEDAKFVCYHTKEDYGKWGDLHRLFDHDFSNYGWSVVGNIYKNPELLATSNQQQP